MRHPLVGDWQQRHYFGLASFFQRTFPTRTGLVSEKFDGRLKFTTTEGEEHQAEFVFLTGASVSDPGLALDDTLKKDINAKIRSVRQQIAALDRKEARIRERLMAALERYRELGGTHSDDESQTAQSEHAEQGRQEITKLHTNSP